ncbi:hypothetical protein [Mammaliicoccus sp. N-M52]|uniref:hypothetical protein n=1 Tax=Mammaliicoccus sp. N-M52 TaxID=2898711 RepID=UPI001EFA6ED7|nr:hypothetical protein [Mammaliicoccus sp. N-M52]
MLEYNRLSGVELKVEKLLKSPISLKEISEHTGISESILKKLSSGEQSISNAKYNTVESLYNYYVERSNEIELYINNETEHAHVKLPKKLTKLIDDIEKAVQEVNDQKQNVDVVVKKIYANKENGTVHVKKKEIEINQLIGFELVGINGLKTFREPYQLIVTTQVIESIDKLNSFKIIFDKQGLIETLKQIKHEGGKIDVEKSGYHNSKGIRVCPKNTSITKYKNYDYISKFETNFMSISFTTFQEHENPQLQPDSDNEIKL